MFLGIFKIGVKLSRSFSYIWDKLWFPVYKRNMKYCGKEVFMRPLSCDFKGLENLSVGDGTSIPKGSTFSSINQFSQTLRSEKERTWHH